MVKRSWPLAWGVLVSLAIGTSASCSAEAPQSPEPVGSSTAAVSGEGPGSTLEAVGGNRPIVALTGLPRGAMPRRKGPPDPNARVAANACGGTAPRLLYFGGPILQNVIVYNVNWNSAVNPTIKTEMPKFYADITNSPYWDWLSEYNTVGVAAQDGMPGTPQNLSRGRSGGDYTICPSICPDASACTVTDAQVQAELVAQFDAGTLPKPTIGCDGQVSSLYMINFPVKTTIDMGGGSLSCTGWCAYHSSVVWNGKSVPYGIMPDQGVTASSPCTGCGTDPTGLDDETSTASHELAEAVTDTAVGQDTQNPYARPCAWGDNNCGEIGDICVASNIPDQKITVGPNTWYVQQLWSNYDHDCIALPKTMRPGLCTGANTPPNCKTCTCADDGFGCHGGTSWCETDATNVKAGFCVQCTASSECQSPQTCSKSAMPSQDDVCSSGGACGGPTQPCCTGNTCNPGQLCQGSTCVACGGDGQPCCANNTCATPYSCAAGACGTCTPRTTCAAGDNCGMISDNCGGAINCGAAVSCAACTGSCVNNVCGGGTDGGADSGADAGSDAGVDAGVDSGVDSGADGSFDAGMDGGVDGGFDSGADTGIDGGIDSGGVDAEDDAIADSGPEADSSPGTDAGPGDSAVSQDAAPPTTDGTIDDSGTGQPAADNSGCGCRTARPRGADETLFGSSGALLLGLLVARRRREPAERDRSDRAEAATSPLL